MADMELIKKLRAMTQAGVMDAKKALEENNNDLDAAAKWLREKGIVKAAKKASAVATEGLVKVKIKDNTALIIEINSQTDFVAIGDDFKNATTRIADIIFDKHPSSLDEALQLKIDNQETIADFLTNLIARIGEKISIRRFEFLTKTSDQLFESYVHSNNKIAVLLISNSINNKAMVHEVALHAAAMNPRFLSRENVDQTWLANETAILKTQTIAEGKPADKADMIVKGRVQKILADVCLLEQQFFKDPSKTVSAFAKEHGFVLTKYVRYEVGEGIEKKQTNFAEEVAQQMTQK